MASEVLNIVVKVKEEGAASINGLLSKVKDLKQEIGLVSSSFSDLSEQVSNSIDQTKDSFDNALSSVAEQVTDLSESTIAGLFDSANQGVDGLLNNALCNAHIWCQLESSMCCLFGVTYISNAGV